jgi:hypothetical protein
MTPTAYVPGSVASASVYTAAAGAVDDGDGETPALSSPLQAATNALAARRMVRRRMSFTR